VLRNKDQGFFELYFLCFLVIDEVRRNIATIEPQSLHELNLMLESLALPNRNHSSMAHLLNQLCQQLPDLLVPVSRNRSHIFYLLAVPHWNGNPPELGHNSFHCGVYPLLHLAQIHPNLHFLQGFSENGSGKHCGSSGPISSLVVGLIGNRFDQTGTHIGEPVGELYGFSHGDSVLGDFDWSEALIDEYVAAVGSKGDLDGVGELVAALEHAVAGLVAEEEFFGCEVELEGLSKLFGNTVGLDLHDIILILISTIKLHSLIIIKPILVYSGRMGKKKLID